MPTGHDVAVATLQRHYLGREIQSGVREGKIKKNQRGLPDATPLLPTNIVDGVIIGTEANEEAGDRLHEFPLESEIELETDINALIDVIESSGRIHVVDAIRILQSCTLLHQNTSLLSRVINKTGDTIIVGDIHGQIGDLLSILNTWNPKSNPNTKIVFNGDLVDRGNCGCEVVLLICALKLKYPTQIFINKGNHEEELLNLLYGFYDECNAKYGPYVYSLFVTFFGTLPLSSVVNDTSFIIHGGLFGTTPAPTFKELENMKKSMKKNRRSSERQNVILSHGVWSDPDVSPVGKSSKKRWSHSPRGEGVLFTELLVNDFIKANPKLRRVIRSHQFPGKSGHATIWNGKVVTVFSASNYHNREWIGKDLPTGIHSNIPLSLNTPIKETNKGSVAILSKESNIKFISWSSPLHRLDHPLASFTNPQTKLPFQLSVINGTSSDPRNVDPNEKLVYYVRQKSLVEQRLLIAYWEGVEVRPGIVTFSEWIFGLKSFIPSFQILCGIIPSLPSVLRNRGFTVGSSGEEIRFLSYLQQADFLTQVRPQPLWHREVLMCPSRDVPVDIFEAVSKYSHSRKSTPLSSQQPSAPVLVWKTNPTAHRKNRDLIADEIKILSRIVRHTDLKKRLKFVSSCNALMGLPLSESEIHDLGGNDESKL